MTQSIADRTPQPTTKVWRRHTDPPGLWFIVIAISVASHLSLLWLIRSYQLRVVSQNSLRNALPIELVTVAPKAPAKTQNLSRTRRISPQRSSPVQKTPASPKVVQPTVVPEDNGAIALTDNIKRNSPQTKNSTIEPKKLSPVVPEPTVDSNSPLEAEPTPLLTPSNRVNPLFSETNPTPQTTPFAQEPQQQPVNPTPQTTPFAQEPQQQNPPANPLFSEGNTASSQQNQSDNTPDNSSPPVNEPQITASPSPTGLLDNLPKQPDENIEIGEPTPLPTDAPPIDPNELNLPPVPPRTQELVASWGLATEAEQRQIIGRDLPDNLAQPKQGEPTIFAPVSLHEFKNLNLQPGEFRVSLIISSDGNVEDTVIVDQKVPDDQRVHYKQIADRVFRDRVQFEPATNNDGSKPPSSNLVVHIIIEDRNQKNSF